MVNELSTKMGISWAHSQKRLTHACGCYCVIMQALANSLWALAVLDRLPASVFNPLVAAFVSTRASQTRRGGPSIDNAADAKHLRQVYQAYLVLLSHEPSSGPEAGVAAARVALPAELLRDCLEVG